MPTVSVDLPDDGDDAVVEPYNTAITAILSVFNGGIDADNLAALAVTASKLAAASVTNAKIADNTIIPESKFASNSGWTQISDTHTYSSWDSTNKTGIVTVPSDATAKYSVGMRYRISQATGGTKYFIITAVSSTTLTLYGGTDYTLTNETVSSPCYSVHKSPFGFNSTPTKWMQKLTMTSGNTTTTTVDTYVNPGSINLSVPIGAFYLIYDGNMLQTNSSASIMAARIALSTVNNDADDLDLIRQVVGRASSTSSHLEPVHLEKHLVVATATPYYLVSTIDAGAGTITVGTNFGGGYGNGVIKAVCDYL